MHECTNQVVKVSENLHHVFKVVGVGDKPELLLFLFFLVFHLDFPPCVLQKLNSLDHCLHHLLRILLQFRNLMFPLTSG